MWLLDAGLALENMLIQGYAMGMTIHAMAGYDEKEIAERLRHAPNRSASPPSSRRGWRGKVESLPEDAAKKDLNPRERKANSYFALRDKSGVGGAERLPGERRFFNPR